MIGCKGPTLSMVNKGRRFPLSFYRYWGKGLYIGCLGDEEGRRLPVEGHSSVSRELSDTLLILLASFDF